MDLDTGAAVTLIPLHLARRYGATLSDQPARTTAAPRTLLGPIHGWHGQVPVRLGEIEWMLPCFAHVPPGTAARSVPGGGMRQVDRPGAPHTLADWEADIRAGVRPMPGVRFRRMYLGRLGFLTRFRVRIHPDGTTVSTDPFPDPPSPRQRWKFW